MAKEILIKIRNKIAERISGEYVCGNSDFVAVFDFDEEWSAYDVKTARIDIGDSEPYDVVFNGNQCEIPILKDIHSFYIGVYAGNLRTSTPAYVPARKSILCKGGTPATPKPDVYAQIMEMLNKSNLPPEEIAAAVKKYIDENGIDLGDEYTDVTEDYLESGSEDVGAFLLTLGAGKFYCTDNLYKYYYDGIHNEFGNYLYRTIKAYGDDAYYDESIYINDAKVYEMTADSDGTSILNLTHRQRPDAAVSKKYIDEVMPKALPNPNVLKFTGAVEGSYDGSKPLEVKIPQGGGNKPMELLYSVATEEDVLDIMSGIDPHDYSEILMIARAVSSDSTKSTHFSWYFGGNNSNRPPEAHQILVNNGLHNSQTRCYILHSEKLNDKLWKVQGSGHSLSMNGGNSSSLAGMTSTGWQSGSIAFITTLATDIGCGAYTTGGTKLAAGAELMIWGR